MSHRTNAAHSLIFGICFVVGTTRVLEDFVLILIFPLPSTIDISLAKLFVKMNSQVTTTQTETLDFTLQTVANLQPKIWIYPHRELTTFYLYVNCLSFLFFIHNQIQHVYNTISKYKNKLYGRKVENITSHKSRLLLQ